MNLKKYRYLIAIIILIAGLIIRLIGISHGKPNMIYHPDVAKQITIARQVYNTKSTDPRNSYSDIKRAFYPYGTAYIIGTIYRIFGGKNADKVHRWHWAYRMRIFSIIIIMISFTILYIFLTKHIGFLIASITIFTLAMEPVNAQFSHYGMNDVPLLAIIMLIWPASAYISSINKKALILFSLLTGFLTGLAFGIKYQGILALFFPFVTCLSFLLNKEYKKLIYSTLYLAIGMVLGAFITAPLMAKSPTAFFYGFHEFMQWQANIMETHIPIKEKLIRNVVSYAHFLITTGTFIPFLIIAVWGKSIFNKRTDKISKLLFISASGFAIILSVIITISRDIIRANDLMPITFFAIFASSIIIKQVKHKQNILLITMFFLALFYMTISLLDSLALTGQDTRIFCQKWCKKHIPDGATVIYERYVLPIRKNDLTELRVKFLRDSNAKEIISKGQFDFLITSSLANNRFKNPQSPYFSKKDKEFYELIETNLIKVVTFKRRELLYANPEINIYLNPLSKFNKNATH